MSVGEFGIPETLLGWARGQVPSHHCQTKAEPRLVPHPQGLNDAETSFPFLCPASLLLGAHQHHEPPPSNSANPQCLLCFPGYPSLGFNLERHLRAIFLSIKILL